jgi:sugar-specific transcriptional regulator TrmB
MNTSTMLDVLKTAGLNAYEAKCYLALFERDTLTVPEVSKLAGVPRPNVYEALANLLSKGMCVAKPGNTKKYGPSDPAVLREKVLGEITEGTETALGDLRRKETEIIEKANTAKQNLDSLIGQLEPRYQKSAGEVSPLDYIEIIKDPYQIHKKFMQLVGEAKEEILGFTKPPYSVTKKGMKEQLEQQVQMIKRGLRMRTIWEIPKDQKMMEWLDAYITTG